jgi:DNA-binding transcriptional ArsR family regulator
MFTKHRLAEAAELLADPSRAGILISLWDGRSRPAGQLAAIAGITPATASGHLSRLVQAGLLSVEVRGRNRFYRLAGPEVARAMESLARLLPRVDGPAPNPARVALERARLCYDHLAGSLGVQVADALQERGALRLTSGEFSLTRTGRTWFDRFGVEVAALERARRPLLLTCMDWTERREHLAGGLGAALASQMLERDWLRRVRGERSLLVTSAGRIQLRKTLGLRLE